MSTVKVKVSFNQVVTFTKVVDMDYAEYLSLGERLDQARGREYRQMEADLFARMSFRADDGDYGANDPELDDFQQTT